MTSASAHRTVLALLGGQAVALGFGSAFLVIPANGVFLTAYGARWLPLTYIGIAVVGTLGSVAMTRSLRRWSLPSVGLWSLATMAASIASSSLVISWAGVAWPSAVLLTLFPILLQVGFIIIGGQVGRLLDLQQIKAWFARIVSGFVVGFAVGGFVAAPLLDVLGAVQHLALLSAGALLAFGVLVTVTGRRRPGQLSFVERHDGALARPPLRKLLTGRLIVAVFGYQVLSAMGSQVLDFLVFDRAAARYSDQTELTRFVALYTGLLNLVDMVFLATIAGWLMKRFGLRLGLSANPLVATTLVALMTIAVLGPGPASLAVFSLVVTARTADLALNDGATRGSINAVYQVVPVEERTAVQAAVEGVGVPAAIGATGVVLLTLTALDLGTTATIVFALGLGIAWTTAGFVVHREYHQALADRLRRPGLDPVAAVPLAPEEQAAARRLLLTDEVQDVRLGLDLALVANLAPGDLAHLAAHQHRDVRLLALAQLARRSAAAPPAGTGAKPVASALAAARSEAFQLIGSPEPTDRRAVAAALDDLFPAEGAGGPGDPDTSIGPGRRSLLATLLADPDISVRQAALDSVGHLDGDQVDAVRTGLAHPSTRLSAQRALGRLGPVALAVAAEARSDTTAEQATLVRILRFIEIGADGAATHLLPLTLHRDPGVSTAALAALARNGVLVDEALTDRLLADEASRVAAVTGALVALGGRGPAADAAAEAAGGPGPVLVRALADNLGLSRDRVLAVLAARYGPAPLDAARRALTSDDPARRALGVELLQLSISRAHAVLAEPIMRHDIDLGDLHRRLPPPAFGAGWSVVDWLDDLSLDPFGRWHDPWLQATALVTLWDIDPDRARHHATILVTDDHHLIAETATAVAAGHPWTALA